MFRCIHILACLTVLTTALPPGWCCWVMSSGCCGSPHLVSDSTTIQSDSAPQVELSACGSSCCHDVNRNLAKPDRVETASADATFTSDNQPSLPPRGTFNQCCQRGPLVRAVSFDFLVNPLLTVASNCETLLVQPHSANPADVDISAFSDSVRLHARLGRWLI
jgi:hypothetical protein